MTQRVLIGVTTYEKKDYIFHECMEAVYAQNYPWFDVVIVDNGATLDYVARLKRKGYKNVYHVNRGANSRVAIAKSQNKIRELFLEGDYTHLLLVESDLILPKDSLTRLMNYHKPVVGSTYLIGTKNVKVPCIFLDDVPKDGFTGTRPLGIKELQDGTKAYDGAEIKTFLNTGLRQVHGCGFGCTLIERRIMKDTVFWTDSRFNNKHSDVYFYLDMSRMKVPVFVDTDIMIPHYPTDWETVADR